MKKIRLLFSPLLFIVIFFFFSCDSKRIFEQNVDIPGSGWVIDSVIKLEVAITDTVIPTNFYINVRNADGYPYSNLFLYIKTIFPSGKTANDTLECVLADEQGKWLGNGLGDIYDNQIPFKRNVRFPSSGKYIFEIQHGMRTEIVPLIMDIGLRVERVE